MGRIIGGFATSHVLFSPTGVEDAAGRVFDGMMAIRARIQALKPDLLVVASSDHLNNFTLRQQVTLAIGVADAYTPLGDMGIPQQPFPGQRDFSEAFARFAAASDFDLVQVEEVRPDHGMMLTKLIADPTNAIPTVPLYINSNMPIPPTPARAFALGQVLRSMIMTSRPESERVVVIAGGGLSHWLRVPGQGRVAESFDRFVLDLLTSGQAADIASLDVHEIEEKSGNGGLELIAWLFMAGAMPPKTSGEVMYYEPMTAWGSGMAGLSLRAHQ